MKVVTDHSIQPILPHRMRIASSPPQERNDRTKSFRVQVKRASLVRLLKSVSLSILPLISKAMNGPSFYQTTRFPAWSTVDIFSAVVGVTATGSVVGAISADVELTEVVSVSAEVDLRGVVPIPVIGFCFKDVAVRGSLMKGISARVEVVRVETDR